MSGQAYIGPYQALHTTPTASKGLEPTLGLSPQLGSLANAGYLAMLTASYKAAIRSPVTASCQEVSRVSHLK